MFVMLALNILISNNNIILFIINVLDYSIDNIPII